MNFECETLLEFKSSESVVNWMTRREYKQISELQWSTRCKLEAYISVETSVLVMNLELVTKRRRSKIICSSNTKNMVSGQVVFRSSK